MRRLALVAALVVGASGWIVAAPVGPAAAQVVRPPAAPTAAAPGAPQMQDQDGDRAAPVCAPQPAPRGSKGQALFFWLFAVLTVGGAVATITRRNAIMAVMCLVGTFLVLSGLYVMLFAHFIAVIQVLVYAGAVMVLFVFVVMILNKEEEEPWAIRNGALGKILAIAAVVYLVVRTGSVLWRATRSGVLAESPTMACDFGTTAGMGKTLFGPFLFPFEAVSVVLLIAVVGALVLAHPAHPNVGEETPGPPEGGSP
jgi:NADH-quinone oxidoreductase subunit J